MTNAYREIERYVDILMLINEKHLIVVNRFEKNREINKQDLLCQRCSHVWTYHGKNPYFTLCPYCRTTVRISKKKSSQPNQRKAAEVDNASRGEMP